MKSKMQLVGILSLVFLFFSCKQKVQPENKKASSIEVTDTKGNLVSLNKPAQRIVCLFDPALDLIQMLDASDKLVGIPIETYLDSELYIPLSLLDSRIKNKELKTPGSNELQQIEEIVALKPDLLIVQNLSSGMVKTLNAMGIAVYMATAQSRENLFQELLDIAILTGTQSRGQELEAYATNQFKALQLAAAAIPEMQRKKVYFTWANGRIFSTTGRNSMMNDCLEFAGTVNASTSAIDQPNINPETLVSWNPDIIVMWNDSPDLFYNKHELAQVNAIKNKAIFNLMPMFFYNPHTLKSLCASVAIKEWAYGNTAQAKIKIREVIKNLYGNEKSEKLLTLLP